MSEERLNLIKENVYTRCSVANITGIGMTAPDKEEVELIKEIERLNNIIDKLKIDIENGALKYTYDTDYNRGLSDAFIYMNDRIKELKGSVSNE